MPVPADVATLYGAERARLGRVGRRITADPLDAEEIVQDVFLRLMAGEIVPRGGALLTRMARNLAIDRIRRRAQRDASARDVTGVHPDGIPSSETMLEARQELRDLVRLLEGMPARRRRALLLWRLNGMPQAQIARELGVSLSTVEKELHAALETCVAWKRNR